MFVFLLLVKMKLYNVFVLLCINLDINLDIDSDISLDICLLGWVINQW